MPSNNNLPEEDLLPFGALQGGPVDASVREQLGQATSGKQKVQRSPRALRPPVVLHSDPRDRPGHRRVPDWPDSGRSRL